MAHWLLRERMAEHNDDDPVRRERIRDEQRRAEPSGAYEKAARGGPGDPPRDVTTSPDELRGHEDPSIARRARR